jgi:hypothetical protein
MPAVGYISSINSRDLIIESQRRDGNQLRLRKKIPLVGPASLLLEYEGTTAKSGAKPAKTE